MSKFIGKEVRITCNNPLTNGMKGVVKSYQHGCRKYIIAFHSPWIGYYKRSEFEVI
jgi:hypothetical protein